VGLLALSSFVRISITVSDFLSDGSSLVARVGTPFDPGFALPKIVAPSSFERLLLVSSRILNLVESTERLLCRRHQSLSIDLKIADRLSRRNRFGFLLTFALTALQRKWFQMNFHRES
jgi:hypothetical protein